MKERKLQEIGKSLLVTVPKNWADVLKLKKGSTVRMTITNQGALLIAPEFTAKSEKKNASILFDASGERRFFREYFDGAEKITLNIRGRTREDAHSFLRTFMNVQVIEDGKEKIVVKCFPINELSIEECCARMHFLSLALFDDAIRNAPLRARETTEESITKFYYLLVMQVRRFLGEGQFAKANVPLIRAMDFRMVAEKIERIADILKRFEPRGGEGRELQELKKFYIKAFGCFRNEDFEGAVPIWAEERELRRQVKSPQGASILRLAKEISSFVR